MRNSKVYEINTRVWIKKFGANTNLISVPDDVFKEIAAIGFDAVWLMGIWKTCSSLVEKCCFTPDLISAYSKALKNWEKKDVIGSPYAIDCYEINPSLGETTDILLLKN
ncbi:MAG: glycosidase, partial [Ignavibacteriales bacterium]